MTPRRNRWDLTPKDSNLQATPSRFTGANGKALETPTPGRWGQPTPAGRTMMNMHTPTASEASSRFGATPGTKSSTSRWD